MDSDTRQFYRCSICNSDKFRVIHRFGLYSYQQTVSICKKCGIVCLNPRWDEKRYAAYYQEEYYGKYQPAVFAEENIDVVKIKLSTRSSNIFNDISQITGKEARILEIGCGNGENLVAFLQNGYLRLYGMDASLDCCLKLHQRGISAINMTLAAFVNEGYPHEKYDCIILSHMLEHFVQPERALNMIGDLLSPSGIVYILIPDFYGFNNPYTQFSIPHTFYFCRTTLEMLISNLGYKIEKHCPAELGEIALIITKNDDTLSQVALNTKEYQRIMVHLKRGILNYLRMRIKVILFTSAGWLIMKAFSEETYLKIRSKLNT